VTQALSDAQFDSAIEKYFKNPEQRFLNRELSWLSFNERVMEEARNPDHPLLERVRFLSISGSNMDEFYMVRVAGLNDQVMQGRMSPSQDGLTPAEQLEQIIARTNTLMAEQQRCWKELKELLAKESIHIVDKHELSKEDKTWLKNYFDQQIFPTLTPIAIDPAHPFPFLSNGSLTAVYEILQEGKKKSRTAVLPIPGKLPRFVQLGTGQGWRFIRLEHVVSVFLEDLFPGYQKQASGYFRILRDSDLDISEEAEDLVRHFEKAVKERRRGHVIRLNVSEGMPAPMLRFVSEQLEVPAQYTMQSSGMIGLRDIKELVEIPRPDLKFAEYIPRSPERISDFGGDCFDAIAAKDIIIHHPYETFDVVVDFLQQAARDEDVIAIKQTLYRTSNDSPIVKALIEAAESGKSVTAVVELRARFDEEANMRWARDLERAGAQVVYGFTTLKTHCKISLVTKRESGSLQSFVHFGTGNYHPVTAKIYTDLSFFTCDPQLCRDAAAVFNFLTGYAPPASYHKLAVAPQHLRDALKSHILKEMQHAEEGKTAQIWAKMNSLVDPEMIDLFYHASQAGVQIDLIVRGICCLRPGLEGLSENIRVKSLVGRFLEHSRIYCFGNGEALPSRKAKVFISSADLMQRNLDHRVETLVPIENTTVHAQVLDQIMVANIEDNEQSWVMDGEGAYARTPIEGEPFSAHDYFMQNPSLSGRGKAIKNKSKLPPKLYKLRPKPKSVL